MFNTQKKSEVVYCRFRSGIDALIEARAQSWDLSKASTIEKLAFIGEIAVWAVENTMGQDRGPEQGGSRSETEQLLNAFFGTARKL